MSPASGIKLQAVLFTDVVGSTDVAAEVGDARWREILRRLKDTLRGELKRFRGHEVDTAGDGMFAVFSQPAEAVRCAWSSVEAVRELGIELRAGVHFGECQLSDGLVQGIVVHTGSRIAGLAGPGEVLVSGTVRELVAGSRFGFEDRGWHELRGVPGSWPVFEVSSVGDVEARPVLDPDEARARRGRIGEGPRRRSPALLVGATIGLVAISIALMLLDRSPPREDAQTAPSLPFNAIVRIDVAQDTVTTTHRGLLKIGSEVGGIAAGEGAVWAPDSILRHFDPVTGVEEPGDVDLNISSQMDTHPIAVGLQRVWVATHYEVLAIDPGDEDVLRRTPMKRSGSNLGATFQPVGITTGAGSVWVIWIDGRLVRIDRRGRIEAEIKVGELPAGIVFGGGSVWVTDEFGGDVARVDPGTNEVVDRIPIGGSPNSLAWVDGELWVVDRNQGVIVTVDAASGERLENIPVGPSPIDIEAGLGYIWVGDQADGSVRRFVPGGTFDHRYDLSVEVSGIAVDEERGLVWIRTGGEIPDAA